MLKMVRFKKSFLYLLTLGLIVISGAEKAFAYPSLFYSAGSVRRVSTETCVMEAYSVLSYFGFYPVTNPQRTGNAVFAMARDSETQVIVLCSYISEYGLINVMTASDDRIGMELPKRIKDELTNRLGNY